VKMKRDSVAFFRVHAPSSGDILSLNGLALRFYR